MKVPNAINYERRKYARMVQNKIWLKQGLYAHMHAHTIVMSGAEIECIIELLSSFDFLQLLRVVVVYT